MTKTFWDLRCASHKDQSTELIGASIGKCGELTFDAAKKQACIMLGDIARGCDPKNGKRINTLKNITLREVLKKFLEVRPIRVDTQRNITSPSISISMICQ